jgi:hypothetical protein
MAETIELPADGDEAALVLGPYIQSGNLNFLLGSGASFPAIPTAGNIEAEINALLQAGDEENAARRCLNLIEEIDAAHAAIGAAPEGSPVAIVTASYKRFLSTLDHILFARKSILLPRQATVFTTNYDMFLEHASSLVPAVILNDGFDRSSSLNAEFVFTPERYFDRTYRSGPIYGHQIEIPTINLVKLHGSLSWRRGHDSIVYDPAAIPKLTEAEKADLANVQAYLDKHFLILPNLRKFEETLMERVYYDLLRQFSKAMDNENCVLFAFGFSFADEHILDLTRRSLRNPTAQLIIVAHDAASVEGYRVKFSKQRNVKIVAPAAGAAFDFAAFNQMLAAIPPERAHGK